MVTFQPTHVLVGAPGYAHHVPCSPIPGFGEVEAVDSRGPLLAVTTDGVELHVVPARSVAPSVHTVTKQITGCNECADLLHRSLERNSLLHLRTYFALTTPGSEW